MFSNSQTDKQLSQTKNPSQEGSEVQKLQTQKTKGKASTDVNHSSAADFNEPRQYTPAKELSVKNTWYFS